MVDKVRSNRSLLVCQYQADCKPPAVIFSEWRFTTSLECIRKWYEKSHSNSSEIYINPVVLRSFSSVSYSSGGPYQQQCQKCTVVRLLDSLQELYRVPLKCSASVKKFVEQAAGKHNQKNDNQDGRAGIGNYSNDDSSSNESSDCEDWNLDTLDEEDNNDYSDDGDGDKKAASKLANQCFADGITALAEDTEKDAQCKSGLKSLSALGASQMFSGDAELQQDVSDEEYLDRGDEEDRGLRVQETEINNIELKRAKMAVKNKTVDLVNSALAYS